MNLCVADLPVGCEVRFRMPGSVVYEGRVLHNYGRGIVLAKGDGTLVQFDGCLAETVETVNAESSALYRQNISKKQAEFKQFSEKVQESR
jgi:hypothetical protein